MAKSKESEPAIATVTPLKIDPSKYDEAKEVHIKLEAQAIAEDGSISRIYSHEITLPMAPMGFEKVTHELSKLYIQACRRVTQACHGDHRRQRCTRTKK